MEQTVMAIKEPPARYQEKYRLQYHFSPAKNWMNDPNGLIHHNGVYHLFYQYNPHGDTWGHMSWGHAVSADLVRWTERPLAIPEHDGVMIFSGNVVVDEKNASGLGTVDHPPMLAFYTGYREKDGRFQDQRIAYSLDEGETWTQYEKNPVLDLGLIDFRDPQVFWYSATQKWVMAVALSDIKKIQFYDSADLLSWTLTGEFGPEGSSSEEWECPNLFPVQTTCGEKWCLLVSVGGRQTGFPPGVQYFVGHFDGRTFVNENPADQILWLDRGYDLFAPQIYTNAPDNRLIYIGWLITWMYAGEVPTAPWRCSMSLPRELGLEQTTEGWRVRQQAVPELASLRTDAAWSYKRLSPTQLNEKLVADGVRGRRIEIVIRVTCDEADPLFQLSLLGSRDRSTCTKVTYNKKAILLDRSSSGNTSFSPKFHPTMSTPMAGNKEMRLHIFVDWSSVELFTEGGAPSISARVFPPEDADHISSAGSGCIVDADIYVLDSIWTDH